MKEEMYVLKYCSKRTSIIISSILIPLFIFFIGRIGVSFVSFCLLVLGLFCGGLIFLNVVISRKEYHYLVDRKNQVLFIDGGLRQNKKIPFSEMKGIALGKKIVKNTPHYYLQIIVSPSYWNKFNQEKEQKAMDNLDYYEEMYLTWGEIHQTEKELEDLVLYIVESGIERVVFKPDGIDNKYPGKVKKDYYSRMDQTESPIVVRRRRREIVSYIFMFIFFILFVWSIWLKIVDAR